MELFLQHQAPLPDLLCEDDFEIIDVPTAVSETTETQPEEKPSAMNNEPQSAFVNMLMPLADNNLAFTENMSLTHASTLSSHLDFFFEVLKGTSAERIHALLEEAWKDSPINALKLIWHLRDVRSGKGEPAEFYICMRWLLENHPKTALENLKSVPEAGYWKDLLALLLILFDGKEGLKILKGTPREAGQDRKARNEYKKKIQAMSPEEREKTREERINAAKEKSRVQHLKELEERKAKQKTLLENAKEKYTKDEKYRNFHIKVATLFATQLIKDKKMMEKKGKVSYAGKWAPSPGLQHDKYTLIASTVAELLFPPSKHQGPEESYADYIKKARIMYQKQYLTSLRAYQKVPEVSMAADNWNEIEYTRVPSICMKKSTKLFKKHDQERFEEYLSKVADGEKTIASGALKPHEIVLAVERESDETSLKTFELQWADYARRLAQIGKLESCMAICDVSGSMEGTPMEVAVALSMLLCEITKPPFNNLLITFSERPQLHLVKGNTLKEKINDVKRMDWGGNTNFQAVFDLILNRAIVNKLPSDEMVKQLFVFSDMEFDEACSGQWTTDHEIVKSKYRKAGYDIPRIVYWNVRGERIGATSKPVTKNEQGVALISGFSGQLMKLFLEGNIEDFTPLSVMMAAINDKYNDLKICD